MLLTRIGYHTRLAFSAQDVIYFSTMEYKSIIRILGILLMLFSFAMLPPLAVALWFKDGGLVEFGITFFLTFFTGTLLWLFNHTGNKDLRNRDGFLIVVLFYTVLSVFACIPFLIGNTLHVTLADGVFEAVSGLTTTGASVISHLDGLPHSILFYRQQLQFLGGMGIIVLAVAILPMLGIGGMSLYRAEAPGPVKDAKLTPRLAETAKALWYIYVGLVCSCIIALHLAGMPWFTAIGESFSVVSTGGFSMHDSSYLHYDNIPIELITIFFMIVGGTNFGLHYQFLKRRKWSLYWEDTEFRTYLFIMMFAVGIVALTLYTHHVYDGKTSVIKSLFNVSSMLTTTGLVSADFSHWPTFIPLLMMILGIIGGCGASTSGGVKVIRVLLLRKQVAREIKQLVHPKAIIPIKMGEHVLPDRVVQAIWGYLGIFVVIFVLLVLVLLAAGLDGATAFSAVAACLPNGGVGLGHVAQNFAYISDFSKWVLIVTMLGGRLEIFSLLVLFAPSFWKD